MTNEDFVLLVAHLETSQEYEELDGELDDYDAFETLHTIIRIARDLLK